MPEFEVEFTFPPSVRFEQLLRAYGIEVIWHRRQIESETDPDTGEPKITFATETIKAIVREVTAAEIELGGLMAENKAIIIYVHENVKYLDKITYNNEEYEVGPTQDFHFKGKLEYRMALCRRLQT